MSAGAVDAPTFDAWSELLPLWELGAADRGELPFYRALAESSPRPVVELGIGYGRVAAHVEPDVGVDYSAAMLERCRARLGDAVALVEADLRDYALERPAGLSYAPLNTFNAILDPAAREDALRNVRTNTAPGGRLAFDAFVPDHERLRARDGLWAVKARGPRSVVHSATSVADPAGGVLRMDACVDELDEGGRVVARRYFPPMPLAAVEPAAWEELFARTGWTVERALGGFEDVPLAPGAKWQVWVLRREA